MRLNTGHWLAAGLIAIALHGVLLIGLRPDVSGAASDPTGPSIEMAESLAGLLGEPLDVSETPVEELEAAEPPPPEVVETSQPVEVAASAPVVVPNEISAAESLPVVTTNEVKEVEPAKVLTPKKTKKKIETRKTRPKKVEKPKKKVSKKKTVKARKKTTKRSGNSRSGSAGKSNRKRASSAAIAGYGSKVRSRIASAARGASRGKGRLTITVSLSASGGLRSARISRSSGNGALDRAVLASVKRTSFPRPPAGMSAKSYSVSITFR